MRWDSGKVFFPEFHEQVRKETDKNEESSHASAGKLQSAAGIRRRSERSERAGEGVCAENSDWQLDGKEYFEGSNSGYKNAVVDRDILQEALRDAENGEYDILVAYKDDRIGRRLWDVGQLCHGTEKVRC